MNATFPGLVIQKELDTITREIEKAELEDGECSEKAEYRRFVDAKRGVFELKVCQYLGLFELACRVNEEWREGVFRGEEPPSQEVDQKMHHVFSLWLELNGHFRERAEYFKRHGSKVEGKLLLDLRLYESEARQILADWSPAELSIAFGLRSIKMNEEQVNRLRATLGAARD